MDRPAKIGRYDITDEIGRGAMGVVYLANDPMLERTVAVKTINMAMEQGEIEHYEKRFNIEARAAGGLNHPNIVTIHDIGRCGDLAYMAMEFLDGRELRDLIAANEVTADQALDIAAQVADGLAYAHAHEVVHRDIKPANIMILSDGRVKITDFGIARMRTADVRTQTGVVLGSPRYLSPEQVLGKRSDGRTDIFSLGVILYEMVTGQTPFTGYDVNSLMFQIVNFKEASPSELNPALPQMLDLIIAKALAKAPDDRYPSIAEFAADLRECRKPSADGKPNISLQVKPQRKAADAIGGLTDTLPATRADDREITIPNDSMPARGIAKEFDSLAATMRLAARTGALSDPTEFAETFGVSRHTIDAAILEADEEDERNWSTTTVMHVPPWSVRDWQIFIGAVFSAMALGTLIVLA